MPRGKSNGSAAANSSGEKKQYDNSVRRWYHPQKRAAGYAKERKAKVYARGPKKDQPMSEYDLGVRSGYLLARNDEAGMYKYKAALNSGMSKAEARAASRKKGK